MFFKNHHDSPPVPFNPDFRKGFGEALSKEHDKWCDANPGVTREVRKAAYKATAERLAPNFPSVRELGGPCCTPY